MLIGASSCAQLQLICVRQCCQCFLLSTSPERESERVCVCVCGFGRHSQDVSGSAEADLARQTDTAGDRMAGEDDERAHTYWT